MFAPPKSPPRAGVGGEIKKPCLMGSFANAMVPVANPKVLFAKPNGLACKPNGNTIG